MRSTLFPFLIFIMLVFTGCNEEETKTTANASGNTSSERPKNVILMIGDGMGLTQITSGMIANGNKLQLERFKKIGFIKTSSSDKLITDSAAGATAFASGEKTYNGAIGVNEDTVAIKTILEMAAQDDYKTGLIATSSITHATPACFYAHQPSRKLDEAIAGDMVNSPVDIFMGGGKSFFGSRSDGKNLLDSLKSNGFNIYDEVADIKMEEDKKIACFIADEQPISYLEGRGDYLTEATEKALEFLDKDKGFFLMIEGSQIDWASHSNNSDGTVAEMIDFDRAIGQVLDFAEKDGNTLVIVTADHETGGYAIVGGNLENNTVVGDFSTGHHTAAMVPVFAYGTGADEFAGIYENTAIFDKIAKAMGF